MKIETSSRLMQTGNYQLTYGNKNVVGQKSAIVWATNAAQAVVIVLGGCDQLIGNNYRVGVLFGTVARTDLPEDVTPNPTPPAAGQAAHTLLPEYKATNGSRYHIAQRVQTDTGMKIWREIATFCERERRDEVLRACNSHAALVAENAELREELAEAEEAGNKVLMESRWGQEYEKACIKISEQHDEIQRLRAALQSGKGVQP